MRPAAPRGNHALTTGVRVSTTGPGHEEAAVGMDHSMTLGPDRLPRPDLFIEDGQHMTRAGYEIWTDIVRPHLR